MYLLLNAFTSNKTFLKKKRKANTFIHLQMKIISLKRHNRRRDFLIDWIPLTNWFYFVSLKNIFKSGFYFILKWITELFPTTIRFTMKSILNIFSNSIRKQRISWFWHLILCESLKAFNFCFCFLKKFKSFYCLTVTVFIFSKDPSNHQFCFPSIPPSVYLKLPFIILWFALKKIVEFLFTISFFLKLKLIASI